MRVAQIGYDMVAVSNIPTPEKIHSILDRHRTAALPFAGSTLLSQHFHDVPLLALAWGVGQIGLPFNENGAIQIFGFRLPLQSDSTIVASLSPELSLAGALRLRVEEIAPSERRRRQPGRLPEHTGHAGPRLYRAAERQSANRGLKDCSSRLKSPRPATAC